MDKGDVKPFEVIQFPPLELSENGLLKPLTSRGFVQEFSSSLDKYSQIWAAYGTFSTEDCSRLLLSFDREKLHWLSVVIGLNTVVSLAKHFRVEHPGVGLFRSALVDITSQGRVLAMPPDDWFDSSGDFGDPEYLGYEADRCCGGPRRSAIRTLSYERSGPPPLAATAWEKYKEAIMMMPDQVARFMVWVLNYDGKNFEVML